MSHFRCNVWDCREEAAVRVTIHKVAPLPVRPFRRDFCTPHLEKLRSLCCDSGVPFDVEIEELT